MTLERFARSSAAIAVAAVLVLVVPLGRLALARVSVTVTCCCGHHEAGEECGCANCPSEVQGRDADRDAPRTPELRRCGLETELGPVPADAPFLLHAEVDVLDRRMSIPARADPAPPGDPPIDPPPRPS